MNGLIFEKLLRISVINANEHSEGAIINYLQNDVGKLDVFMWAFDTIVMSSVNLVLVIVFGIQIFGLNFLLLIACLIILGFVNSLILKLRLKFSALKNKETDKRIEVTRLALQNIEYIKQNSLEISYFRKIMDIRTKELKFLVKSASSLAAMAFLGPFGNMLSVIIFLKFYFWFKGTDQESGGYFDVASATLFLRLYGLLKDLMSNLPSAFSHYGDLGVSMDRILKFIDSREVR